ncbi:hypothetical protein ACUXST_001392 [Sphingomonas sp. F9_3S_D5_B_2]
MAEYNQFPEPTLTAPKLDREAATREASERLEIYKLLVEMADRVSLRRQAANSFYLSVNTLIVGGSALLRTMKLEAGNSVVIAVAGIAISVLWARSIASYASLNDAKFGVINELEKTLAVQPFADEWARLHPAEDAPAEATKKRHRPFHTVEVWIPAVFILLYFIQIAVNVPWHSICAAVSHMLSPK